jgi:hypothetical protein
MSFHFVCRKLNSESQVFQMADSILSKEEKVECNGGLEIIEDIASEPSDNRINLYINPSSDNFYII